MQPWQLFGSKVRNDMSAADVWEIRDKSGALLFMGSLRQCEDWLDLNENTRRIPVEVQHRREDPDSYREGGLDEHAPSPPSSR
jgi:hypothetical protein